LARIGLFPNFQRFLKRNPRFYQAAVTQNDPGVARNLQAKFSEDRTVSEFSTIFKSEICGSIKPP
jgi:hypothetical protein